VSRGSPMETDPDHSAGARPEASRAPEHQQLPIFGTVPVPDAAPADPMATTWPGSRPPVPGTDAGPPRHISDYHLLREIGAGGMGRVFEAVDVNLSRRVALKVIQNKLTGRDASERFVLESQTLAKFTHPGIAQIFAAGHYEDPRLTPTRTPYFVMEYIPHATSITEYATRRALDVEARVRLFIRVCESVEHAHRHRVIHRDLKPSNIIISDIPSDSGEFHLPQPKVIDFGIAREVDHQIAIAGHQHAGTLEYMSPEQCDGRVLDERADLYSLGVVLFQLLTDRFPYPVAAASCTQDAVRIIRDVPARRLGSYSAALKGDLDAIVAKALAKDPDQRYPSVARLRADLERYLCAEAVEARWDSLVYVASRRIRGWLGHHPRSAHVALALLASIFFTIAPGFALVYTIAPLARLQGRLQSAVFGASTLPPAAEHTLIIGSFTDQNRLFAAAIASRAALSPATGVARRGIWAVLIDRLSRTNPRAVGFDIAFRPSGDAAAGPVANRAFAASLGRFERMQGMPAVCAGIFAHDADEDAAAVSPTLRPHLSVGAGVTSLGYGDMIAAHLFNQPRGEEVRPGFVLAMIASERLANAARTEGVPGGASLRARILPRPTEGSGAFADLGLLPEVASTLDVILPEAIDPSDRAGAPIEYGVLGRIESGPLATLKANPELGLNDGDLGGLLYSEVPGRDFFDAATIDVVDVLSLSESELCRLVRNKVIVIAQFDPMTSPLDQLPPDCEVGDFVMLDSGRVIPGAWTHVAAIESMQRDVIRLMPPERIRTFALFASAAGAVVAWRLNKRRFKGVMILALAALMMTLAGLVIYRVAHTMVNPFSPALAMLFSAVMSWAVLSVAAPGAGRRGTVRGFAS